MSVPVAQTDSIPQPAMPVAKPRPRLRVWPAVVIAVAYWVAMVTIMRLDMVISQTFFSTVIASFVTGLAFMI